MNFETIEKISCALEERRVTSEDLTEAVISEVLARDVAIGGYSDLVLRTARAEAKAADKRSRANHRMSRLDGVPIAIKDLIDTTPAICRAGLDHLAEYRPARDATVVSRLRSAGAVILGVTETDPGAFSTDTAQVIHPFEPDRFVGGSSGGSAAVVAAGMAFAALGTDTGGSIRIPASCCSVYGFKPTWGRVDTCGVRPLARSLDHVGPIARCVTDLELIQEVIDPTFQRQSENDPSGSLRLGVAKLYAADASAAVKQGFAEALEKLRECGVTFLDTDLPAPDEVQEFHMVNLPEEAAEYHLMHFPGVWRSYPNIARETIEIGLDIDQQVSAEAKLMRNEIRRRVDQALRKVDAIIVPTMPVTAPSRDKTEFRLNGHQHSRLATTIRYTSLFNQTGHPVVSMPVHVFDDRRTVSVQIVGRRNSDENVLRLAKCVEHMISLKFDYAWHLNANMDAVIEIRRELEGS